MSIDPSRRLHGCSVIVPCYQEQGAVEQTVHEVDHALASMDCESEMVFVNDGSSDNTGTILDELEQKYQRLRVVHNEVNRGYGASLKVGFLKSDYDRIVITDADGTYPNERIPDIVQDLEKVDMVVGARVGSNVKIPLLRRPAKWLLLKYSRWMSRADIQDINSGLRAMRAEHIRTFWFMLPDAFSFTTTITLAMHMQGLTVVYKPIDYHQRLGSSSIRPIRDTLRFFMLVFRSVMYFRPLQVFGVVAVLLIAASVAIGIVSKILYGVVPDVTVTILFATGIIVFCMGLLGDLVNARRAR